jgi:hypothetical protein
LALWLLWPSGVVHPAVCACQHVRLWRGADSAVLSQVFVHSGIISNIGFHCTICHDSCWPKFKTGILERSKLESFGRSKLDARPTVNVDADQSTVQALSLHIQSQSRIPFLSTVRAMLRRLARQLARPVAPGIATVATPKSTRRDKPFPSA